MIEEFLTPIKNEDLIGLSMLPKQIIGKNISIYKEDEDFPDLLNCSIAIIGVFENRNSFFPVSNYDLIKFRNSFYELYPGNWHLNIVDLGNIENGETVEDTYYALKEICLYLSSLNTVPIIIGGSHDLIYPIYQSFQAKKQLVNIVSIDRSFDFSQEEELISGRSYMSKIIMEEPNFLNNYTNVAYQNYYCAQEEKDLMDKLYFDSIRLGDVLNDVRQVEPVFRDADIVSFDMKSLSWQASGDLNSIPNGLDSRTICSLSRYAGISDKVSFLGLVELTSTSVFDKLLAQIVWYFIEGVHYRFNEYPILIKEGFLKFNVALSDRSMVFYKSEKSQRWWIELINEQYSNNKLKTSTLLPCTEEDYKQAANDRIPERWFNAVKRMN